MSKPQTISSTFVPPPLDGLNLISGPADYKMTEARVLDNFRVFDFGIRQVGAPTKSISTGAEVAMMYPYTQAGTQNARMFYATDNKIYRLDSPTAVSGTDITGAAVITTNQWQPCYHNKRLFLFNGIDTPLVHDFGTGNVAAFAPSGPTAALLVQGTSYNHRLYIVEGSSTTLWYGGVDAISGTFRALDLGTVFKSSGYLSFVTTWTLNQGLENKDFLVAVNSEGEVLMFQGDYPDAANWTLIARSRIPEFFFPFRNQPYLRLGTELYVTTVRGVIPLSSTIVGSEAQTPYYSASRRIKDQALSSIQPTADTSYPFAYFPNNVGDGIGDIYCLNYERGAWSRIKHGDLTSNSTIRALAVFDGYLMVGTGSSDYGIWYYDLSAGSASSALTYTWKTPFFDFGSHLVKDMKMIRVLGRNVANAGNVKNSVSISTELIDPASPTVDTASTAVDADSDTIQELAPAGQGRRLSVCFSRVGTDAADELNELRGFEAFMEEGGAY